MTQIKYTHSAEVHNQNAAREILPFVFDLIAPQSVLDIGCGTGSWLAGAKFLGIQAVTGVDGISVEKTLMEIQDTEFKLHDLTHALDLKTKYDLAISLEVAEHLPETAADNLLDILTKHSDTILFSAAIPGQGGQFHINEQWPSYWQSKFNQRGYKAFDLLRDKFWDNDKVEWWYRQNMVIYAKPEKAKVFGEPCEKVLARVHPDLFAEVPRLRYVLQDRIWNPKLIPSLKLLAKSLLQQ